MAVSNTVLPFVTGKNVINLGVMVSWNSFYYFYLVFVWLSSFFLNVKCALSKTIMYLNNMKSSNLSFGVWNLDIISAKITQE